MDDNQTEPNEGISAFGKGVRILFVDNEEVITHLGEQMLRRLGHEVVTRTNPVEALDLFRSQPDQFDLVITDLSMPVMNGDVMAREFLRIRPDVRIVLCTGFAEPEETENDRETGIKVVLEKPISAEKLARAIEKALG